MPRSRRLARGTLFLIAGPSGAGKDTLIAEARKRLSEHYVFPRRVITRPTRSDAELHSFETEARFQQSRADGAFALSWEAHGLLYGVPRSIDEDLKSGRHVVINVSRDVVATARQAYDPARTILVTAPREVLERRLATRGREPPGDIALRLARQLEVEADAVVCNEGNLGTALDQFLTALTN